jgi:fructuronate reductase
MVDRESTTEKRLSLATLPGLPPGITASKVNRTATSIGIVHFGIGAFHRTHQAVYTEDAAAATGDTRWGILGVTGRTESVVDQLRPQDCLYGVLEKGAASTSLRIIGAVHEVVWPGRDSQRVVDVLADPGAHIATLTITEKGYARAQDGRIDLELPAVRHDLAILEREIAGGSDSSMSRTPLGLLVRGLARRRRENGAPFTVLPCDNLVDNGAVTRRVVRSLVEAMEISEGRESLLAWLDASVTFPSTMVDRIAPAVSADDRAEGTRLTGLRDDALVVAEPFSQWVIEDRFAGPRPAWELVGAILTDDVSQYERAKLRVLNATHSFLAYLGALKGYATIAEAADDPALRDAARRVLDDDILPTLESPPGMDLEHYRDEVLARFANPALAHTTRQVAMDGSQKLPNRLLGTVAVRLAAGQVPKGLALILASWITYLCSTLADDGPVLDDPLAALLASTVGSASAIEEDALALVVRVLALREIFPEELARSVELRGAIVAQFSRVRELAATSEPMA